MAVLRLRDLASFVMDPSCIIEHVAGNALCHECLALLADHAVEGLLAAPIAAHATIRTEILQIGLHCAARLETGRILLLF